MAESTELKLTPCTGSVHLSRDPFQGLLGSLLICSVSWCYLLLSFSTPEFTHLPHHDNYFHGNHSWHHRHKLTARETRATETLLEAYGLCDLRDSKARTKGTLSWGSNGNVILEIYSYILIFLGASHCPEACEYGQRAMIFLKWRHSTCTQKQTNRTNRLQPEDINP